MHEFDFAVEFQPNEGDCPTSLLGAAVVLGVAVVALVILDGWSNNAHAGRPPASQGGALAPPKVSTAPETLAFAAAEWARPTALPALSPPPVSPVHASVAPSGDAVQNAVPGSDAPTASRAADLPPLPALPDPQVPDPRLLVPQLRNDPLRGPTPGGVEAGTAHVPVTTAAPAADAGAPFDAAFATAGQVVNGSADLGSAFAVSESDSAPTRAPPAEAPPDGCTAGGGAARYGGSAPAGVLPLAANDPPRRVNLLAHVRANTSTCACDPLFRPDWPLLRTRNSYARFGAPRTKEIRWT